MVDLTDVFGDNPMRANLVKKRDKVKDRIDAIEERAAPFRRDYEMFCKMISAIDENEAVKTLKELGNEGAEAGLFASDRDI